MKLEKFEGSRFELSSQASKSVTGGGVDYSWKTENTNTNGACYVDEVINDIFVVIC